MSEWFQRSENYSNVIDRLGIPEGHYLSLMQSIKKVFPKEWVAEQLQKRDSRYPAVMNALLPTLFGHLHYNPIPLFLGRVTGGDLSFVSLIRLGQLIQTMEGEIGAERLFARLRGDPADYMSARFELEVLEVFKKAGFWLKKATESDGVDFTFEKDRKEILVEATHRGASWILDLRDEVSSRSFQRGWSTNRFVRLKLTYKRKYFTDAVVEEIVNTIVKIGRGFLSGFEDPAGNYSISQEESDTNALSIGWHSQGREWVYEAKDLFKSKLRDKKRQLSMNIGT